MTTYCVHTLAHTCFIAASGPVYAQRGPVCSHRQRPPGQRDLRHLVVAGEAAANGRLQDSSDGTQGRDPQGFEELRRGAGESEGVERCGEHERSKEGSGSYALATSA